MSDETRPSNPATSSEASAPQTQSRRSFLRKLGFGCAGLGVAAASYGFYEASWFHLERTRLPIRNLPPAFAGLTVAFLSDFHHGPHTGKAYIQRIVEQVNQTKPDLILLGGDYVIHSSEYVMSIFEALAKLKAPLGIFGIFGNHDYYNKIRQARDAMNLAGIQELTNARIPIIKNSQKLWICGVGDLWEDRPVLDKALHGLNDKDCSILLSHNPDLAEKLNDSRISIMLSGHTHGGQIVLPAIGCPWIPSHYGNRYDAGLKTYPGQVPVFISRGIGTTAYPVRFCSRPEANIFTLEKSPEV